MMRKFALLAAVVLCFLQSCSIDVAPSAYVNVTTVGFDKEGGCYYVVLAANSSWEASSEDESVVIEPSSGYGSMPVSITVPANRGRETNTIRITFTVTGQGESSSSTRTAKTVATINASPFIDATAEAVELTAQGGGARFTVQTNCDWVLEGNTPQWLSVTPQGGTYNSIIEVYAPVNNSGTSRSFKLSFAVVGSEDLKVSVNVVQNSI